LVVEKSLPFIEKSWQTAVISSTLGIN